MNDNQYEKIYQDLGFEPVNDITNLTMGRTVASIIESYIYSKGITKDLFKTIGKKSNADWLKDSNTTSKYLMKVDGGRCFNNRPLEITDSCEPNTFRFIDVDFSGAYSVPQTKIPYPIGNPIILDYPLSELKSSQPNYMTLREFLKQFRDELVPGLWVARVSLKEGYKLKHRQDIFMSWFPGNIKKYKSDTDNQSDSDNYNIDDMGYSKILTNEINLAILNHDLLEWIENVASRNQRKELMDNLLIVTAIIYPKIFQVDTVEELKEKYKDYEGNNSCEIIFDKGKVRKINELVEPYYWLGLPYGDDFINKMKELRSQYDKGTSLNSLYKLNINTAYGDIVSRFFNIGNVVLGNNITAMTRTAMWCLEKCFYGYQSITDGCIINLDTLPCEMPGNRLTGENTVTPHRYYSKQINWVKDKVSVSEMLNNKDGKIETWLKETLISTFPNISCLEYYDIEIKSIADKVIFHGNANYSMDNVIHVKEVKKRGETIEDYYGGDFVGYHHGGAYNDMEDIDTELTQPKKEIKYDDPVYKMRSYKREVEEYDWDNYDDYDIELFKKDKKINLHKLFLNNLANNPNQVKRLEPMTLFKILKPKEVKRRQKSIGQTNRTKGEQIDVPRLPLEISINQFPYKYRKQYEQFKKEHEKLKEDYGQGFEMYFINNDGTLNYELAIRTIDKAISKDAMSFKKWIEKIPKLSTEKSQHPHLDQKRELEANLDFSYTWDDDDI